MLTPSSARPLSHSTRSPLPASTSSRWKHATRGWWACCCAFPTRYVRHRKLRRYLGWRRRADVESLYTQSGQESPIEPSLRPARRYRPPELRRGAGCRQASSRARSHACGSERSFRCPWSSHSVTAPTSPRAHPSTVRYARRTGLADDSLRLLFMEVIRISWFTRLHHACQGWPFARENTSGSPSDDWYGAPDLVTGDAFGGFLFIPVGVR